MKNEINKNGHLLLDIEAHKKTDIIRNNKFGGWEGSAWIEGKSHTGEFSPFEIYTGDDGLEYEVNWELYFYPEG